MESKKKKKLLVLKQIQESLEMQSLQVALQDQPFQNAPMTPVLSLQMITSMS